MVADGATTGPNRPSPARIGVGRAVVLIASAVCLLVASTGCSDEPDPVAGTTTIQAGGVAFNAVVREAVVREPAADADDDDDALTVLFLHGGSYTSRIWAERGVLDRVAGAGHRAVAVDLPGAGATDPTDVPPGEVLAALVEAVGPAGRVVLVSPSASGRYSLALLADPSDVELAGFVAVAPVAIRGFVPDPAVADLPALLVWGEDDEVIPLAEAEVLRSQLPTSELIEVPGGSHAPYDDQPEAFTEILLGFLAGL